MNELKRLKEMAGIAEDGPIRDQKTTQELNSVLGHIGFIGRDLRETKESLEKDGGQSIIDYCNQAIHLVRKINHNPN